MNQIDLSNSQVEEIKLLLGAENYSFKNRDMCIRYYKGQGDSTFIHHSLNIIRCSKNTYGQSIVSKYLGAPNGKASESQEASYDTWFLNGYTGKAGSKAY
jgi:hypothetical protein